MKIVYIALKGLPQGGGVEKFTEEVGARLAARGHEVVVYAMRHYGAKTGTHMGIKVKAFRTIRSRILEKPVLMLLSTIAQIFERRVDIVHFHGFGAGLFYPIPKIQGRVIVTQGHGIEWRRSRWGSVGRWVLKVMEKVVVRGSHAITVVSQVQQTYLSEKYGIQSVVIRNGVSAPSLLEPCIIKKYGLEKKNFVLFAARLVSEKGAHYLIEAWKTLQTDLKLVIAGDCPYETDYVSNLWSLADEREDILFTGHVSGDELTELFSNAYLFVLPSELEGLPIALLEAMSFGRCCLASDIPENLEASGGCCFHFKNKDISDLATKLGYLLAEPEEVERAGVAARDLVFKNQTWDMVTDRFEEFYTQAIASVRGPRVLR